RPDLDGTPLFPIGDGVVVFDHPRLPEESATLTLWIDVVTVLGVSSGAEPFMIQYDPNGDHDGDRTANSRDPDDDGDGLSDAEEIAEHRTNPTAFDTDGDGLGDGDEIDLGTDPLARDTDRDGTIDGEDPDPTDPDVPGRCPPEKDVRCAGI